MKTPFPPTAAVVLLLAGCAAQEPVRFHTLLGGAPPASAAPQALRFRIESPVRVPPQVDQPQIVLRRPDGSLQVLEQQRWVAPLADEWRDALAQRLARTLGALDVSRVGAPPGPAPYVLQLELQRFDSVPGGQVLQQVQWSLRRPADTAPALACLTHASEPAGADVATVAAAHRRAVSQLAEAIAAAVRRLEQGQPARCPD
ncbi:MAG: PqiC family protein [Pseudomonadota bacterium]